MDIYLDKCDLSVTAQYLLIPCKSLCQNITKFLVLIIAIFINGVFGNI